MAMQQTVHPYFTAKARAAFTAAGGNPDNSAALAAWAQAAHEAGDTHVGVIVAQDGTVVAKTRYYPKPPRLAASTYITDSIDPAQVGRVYDLAMGALRRTTGQQLIHLRYWEVCQGHVAH